MMNTQAAVYVPKILPCIGGKSYDSYEHTQRAANQTRRQQQYQTCRQQQYYIKKVQLVQFLVYCILLPNLDCIICVMLLRFNMEERCKK
jgi:hypothetical protein